MNHWEPMRCEVCGSVEFQEADFRQYYEGLYSSGAGGDLRAQSELPLRVRICLCGEPVRPERQPNPDSRSVRAAIKQARAYRATLRPEALLQRLLASLAGKAELALLMERLQHLEQVQKQLAGAESARGKPVGDTEPEPPGPSG